MSIHGLQPWPCQSLLMTKQQITIIFTKLYNIKRNSNKMAILLYFSVLTKITAAQNEVLLRYHKVRRLYFLAGIFAATIIASANNL